MNKPSASLQEELLAERELAPDDYQRLVESRLDWPIAEGLNLAHECCDRWASDPQRVALTVHRPDRTSRSWTYRQLMDASCALANVLHDAGLRRGDRVAALLDQGVEAYVGALAAWRAGLVYVPLFVGFGVDAVAQRIGTAEVSAVFVDVRYRDVYRGASEQLSESPLVLTVAAAESTGRHASDVDFWESIQAADSIFETVVTQPDECASLVFSSGTTGEPKGCMQSHSVVLPLQSFLRHTVAPNEDEVIFAGANPGWSYGLYTAGLIVQSLGIRRVVYTGTFNPAQWLRVMEEEQVTFVASAPSAFRGLIEAARATGPLPASVRGGISAGEQLLPVVADGWREIGGGRLQDGYGSSEVGMVLADLAFTEPSSTGATLSVVPGFDVSLLDETGQPSTSDGAIALRDMRWPLLGYRGLPEVWADRFVGPYLTTGDLAVRDDEGRYVVVGRADDLIVTAGYNVGPGEVENIIQTLPGIVEVAVVAAPDERRGSVVRAVIVVDGTVSKDALSDQIQEVVRAQLGRHAYPKVIDYVEALPRTETGKVRKNVLRSQPGDGAR
ncbi:acetyl-CoA synthetase [Actinocorallia herbida]|uniref:Acetyl-CoA synthetase n=1 Tax=Actinocorallia herbida TaxID=58109 RepID=A0A3N1D2V2_9ACTN|nr:AMP-binding protein [Actinocorallia herbida]ROO87842.1 acetyl-CoA synthetase [Actinocorallia herbida]